MPGSTEEAKPVVIDTIKGKTGTENNSQDHFFPVDSNGKPIILGNDPEPVYDENGKPIPEPLLGNVVDVKV